MTLDERARDRCLGKHHRLPESEDPCWRCRVVAFLLQVGIDLGIVIEDDE